ncbi:MAG: thiamine-phosphate kinase [Candidatus Planktophila sp.]
MAFSEAEVLALVGSIFESEPADGVLVGIGDDAAVVQGSTHQVITTDVAVEDVHFSKRWSNAFDIGRKVTAANIADVLAMGATPRYLVVALTLVGDEGLERIAELAHGIKAEADKTGARGVGGDIACGSAISIAITAIGSVEHAITRSGAQVGDGVFISSLTGWSAAGLHLLNHEIEPVHAVHAMALNEFRAPTLDYGIDFSRAHALTDTSDALLISCQSIADASGVNIHLDLTQIKSAYEFTELSLLAQSVGLDVFEWILGGGEDHVFLGTGVDLPGIRIGEVCQGSGVTGLETKKAPQMWRHFQ